MLKLNHNQIVRTLQVTNHILAFIGVVYAIATSQYHLLGLSILVYWFIGIFGINIGYIAKIPIPQIDIMGELRK